jgi:transposase-like protein
VHLINPADVFPYGTNTGRGLDTDHTIPWQLHRSGSDAASFPVRKDAVMPRKFDAATKDRARRLIAEQTAELGSVTKACEVVGAKLGIGKETLRGWAKQAQIDAGTRAGATSEELAQVRALKAKVRSLEEENAILRSAATFFAGELDPRRR